MLGLKTGVSPRVLFNRGQIITNRCMALSICMCVWSDRRPAMCGLVGRFVCKCVDLFMLSNYSGLLLILSYRITVRSLNAKKRRRQIYRCIRNMYRRVRSREKLELLSEESLHQKGCERCEYEALELAKIKEHEQVLQYEVDITKQHPMMLCLPSQLMFK